MVKFCSKSGFCEATFSLYVSSKNRYKFLPESKFQENYPAGIIWIICRLTLRRQALLKIFC